MTLRMLFTGLFNCACLMALFRLGSSDALLPPYQAASFAGILEVACLVGLAYWIRCYERHPGRQTRRGLFRTEAIAFGMFALQCLLGARIAAQYIGDTP